MASASNATTEPTPDQGPEWARRQAAARGEKTTLSFAEWVRLWTRTLALGLGLLVTVPLHYIYRVISYGSPFPKWFLAYATWVVGARVHRHGVPLRRDVFFISNHVSWVDILTLAGASGTAFVAKKELASSPLVGWLASLNRTVFVQREDRLGVAAQINALREALMDNWSVTVFPEGTTTDGHSLLPFKSSMLSVLEPPPPGVLVQPVVLDYGKVAEWIGWIGEEDGLNNYKRVMGRKGTFPLGVHFLEPFSPAEFRGRKAIAAEARARIEETLIREMGHGLRPFDHDVAPIRYSKAKLPPMPEAAASSDTPLP